MDDKKPTDKGLDAKTVAVMILAVLIGLSFSFQFHSSCLLLPVRLLIKAIFTNARIADENSG